jgi:hypothetical protein
LSGGAINNVLRDACLQAVARTPPEIRRQDLLDAIHKQCRMENFGN